jgi:hypothetical protein
MSRTTLLSILIGSLLVVLAIGAGTAQAYDQYTLDKGATYCGACHGDFRNVDYTSLGDGAAWNSDLHDVHRNIMLNGDCDTCHSGSGRFPVYMDFSAGGTGLDAISCTGCHGRLEDAIGGIGTQGAGAGLRQHHWFANKDVGGISTRICLDCHDDADPGNYLPVGEEILPPYYSASDTAHPDIPSDPCNPAADGFPEDYAGTTLGLDNDGNGLYDEADTVPCPEPGQLAMLLPGIGMLLMFERRRRS